MKKKSVVVDMIGKTFDRLVVVARAENDSLNRAVWLCQCKCGNTAVVKGGSLRSGLTRSCGCLQKENAISMGHANKTHGQSHHNGTKRASPEYTAWGRAKGDCYDTKRRNYVNYGGRGIVVAPEWLGPGGFARFFLHIGPRPSSKHSLDRINNDGNYEPGNVRWATAKEQMNNRRSNSSMRHVSFWRGLYHGAVMATQGLQPR